jgi:hypothetical protein
MKSEIKIIKRVRDYVSPSGRRNKKYRCRCYCGKIFITLWDSIRDNRTKSCGCLHRATSRLNGLKQRQHGESKTNIHKCSLEYNSWAGMKTRCYNKKSQDYENYGGRGIRVCKRWRESYTAFLENMGRRPTPRYSLDRINNDGNYEPENCRWATPAQQANNKSNNRGK